MHMYTSLGAMMLQIDIELVECVFCKHTKVVISALHQHFFFKLNLGQMQKDPLEFGSIAKWPLCYQFCIITSKV